MKNLSLYALCLSFFIICIVHLCYYPRWQKTKGEATLSWDVSGYYMYLPAAFIYKDLKSCLFKDEILQKYQLSYNWQQAFVHEESGNYVMKYSIGQAVVFSPAFFMAHLVAKNSLKYENDGFSLPYQFSISIWCLFITLIGLIFLRKGLLHYFNEKTVAISLLAIVAGSNYLNYSAIDGAMTHNNLFTIYAILIYNTIVFYRNLGLARAISIGALIGMAALIRPTEIIACIIPILWGVQINNRESRKGRWTFLKTHSNLLIGSVITCMLFGSIQLIYWKYVSGDWVVYSYEKHGFSWLSPHFFQAMFSYKSGWITYSPMMIFAMLGFICLAFRRASVFSCAVIFIIIFMYINFSWDVWWYGSSLGQRAMVQAYPILMFPLCSFFSWLFKRNGTSKVFIFSLIALFIYANLWFTHHSHKGKVMVPGYMTKSYYWKTLFTSEPKREYLKLLDTDEFFEGERRNVKEVIVNEQDTFELGGQSPMKQFYRFPIQGEFDWLRVNANVRLTEKEWRHWYMTHMIIRFKKGNSVVKEREIRIQRHLDRNKNKEIFMDIQKPDDSFSEIEIEFRHKNKQKSIYIQGIKVEVFDQY